MEDYLSLLNQEQILPVKDTQGPVLVIAGAGSGKTRVLTSRIRYLIDQGVSTQNILAITFTNKAANEMKERLGDVAGIEYAWICTIHSMCVRILRTEADKVGYTRDFSIYSETEKDSVLKKIIKEKNIREEGFIKTLKNAISSAKNKGQNPQEYRLDNKRYHLVEKIYSCYVDYQEYLKNNNALDFDDLLLKTEELFLQNPDVCLKYAQKFEYVHVDEYQDTNKTQYNIIRQLSSYHKNIFVVGDDDQSIYGWRGADISNILDFEKDFAGAKVYKLQRNYRSTKKILDLANKIIVHNSDRKSKVLWTENQDGESVYTYSGADEVKEAEYCAMQIKKLLAQGAKLGDFAVLMRLNALTRSFEQEFLKYGIPYKIFGGFKFFERKEIKDLTSYLRVLVNPLDNEAILRIINLPKRGIGPSVVADLVNYAEQVGLSLFDVIFELDASPLSSLAIKKLTVFKNLLQQLLTDKENMGLTQIVKSIIEKTDFLSQFDNTEEGINKQRNIDEFISATEEFEKLNPKADLTDYLSSVTLSSDTDEMENGEYVTISTIHAVKGLEFKNVFIIGVEEGIFPISRAFDTEYELEEERRLMYVAVTRAKERVFITKSEKRFLYGERKNMAVSRFLTECGLVGKKVPKVEQKDTYDKKYYEDTERDIGPVYGKTGSFRSISTTTQSARPQTAVGQKDYSKFVMGARVKHIKFGIGTIITTRGVGEQMVADIAFTGVGIKSLSVKFAPMEIV